MKTKVSNFNNLNQNQKPGSTGTWGQQWAPAGLTGLKTGGLDLYVDRRGGEFKLNSNLYAQCEDIDMQTISSGVTFLPDYDSYTFGRNNSRSKKFRLTSQHEVIVKRPGLWSKYTASLGYYRWNNNSLAQGAEFGEKTGETYRGQLLETLITPVLYASGDSCSIPFFRPVAMLPYQLP